jgi:hypothetical protein
LEELAHQKNERIFARILLGFTGLTLPLLRMSEKI